MSPARVLTIQSPAHEPTELRFGEWVIALWTDVSPARAEGANQDAAVVIDLAEEGLVAAVSDGAGGHTDGARASLTAVRAIALSVTEGTGSTRERILAGIEAANQEVDAIKGDAGATLALVHLREEQARAYHVGDSRVLQFGQRGRRKFETVAHSPVGYGVEAGLIDEDAALQHEDRHYVSNLLGADDMRIEMSAHLQVAARDTLVVASDGLYANVPVERIVELARRGPLARAAQALRHEAQRGMTPCHVEGAEGNPDDATGIVLRRTRA